jgi:3-methylfumaryl-CoA hydratase
MRDGLDPARAAALHATLNRPGPPPGTGDPLPEFWHHTFFWHALPPAELGRDGHPQPGEFLPDTGLPRRMWGGGVLEFRAPLILGTQAQKLSAITGVKRKQGQSGPLALVTLSHEIRQEARLCLIETQTLLYREEAAPGQTAPTQIKAPTDESCCKTAAFTPTILFRYSALTFNGHRIHYDRAYCRDVEGYPGLVVHGPLLAQFLVQMAVDVLGPLTRFSFRATAPLFDFETAEICAREGKNGLTLWVRGPDGRLCMTAQAAGEKS